MDLRLDQKGISEKLNFPRKLIFSNFKVAALHERRHKLENYLNRLSELLNLVEYDEACEFFEIEPHIKTLLMSAVFDEHYSPKIHPIEESEKSRRREMSEDLILCGGRKEERQIKEFLELLQANSDSIAKIVKEFEELYFGHRLIFNKDEIEQLLWGNSKHKGLLSYCGASSSYIGAEYCLNFFAKLLKYEYNSVEVDKFMQVYAATDPKLIRQIHLDRYIKEIKSQDSPGLIAAFYYLKYNTHDICQPDEIMSDKQAIVEYEKWIKKKVSSGYLFAGSVRKTSSKGTMAGSDNGEDDKEETKSLFGKVIDCNKITKELIENSRKAASERLEYLIEQLDNDSAWELASSFLAEEFDLTEKKPDEEFLAYFSHGKRDFKITLQINKCEDARQVAEQFNDLEKRAKWDTMRRKRIAKEDNTEVIQSMYPTAMKPKFLEYIMAKNVEEYEELEGTYVIIKEFSLTLPQTTTMDIKRVHVDAGITKIAQKIDTEGKRYVEVQMIWSIDEGCQYIAEYDLYKNRGLANQIRLLNKIFE